MQMVDVRSKAVL